MNSKRIIMAMAALLLFHTGNQLNAQSMKEEQVPQNLSAFPVGEANTAYAKYFTGRSFLAPLTKDKDMNCPISNVTFEPSCRNNWHSHTGGQILIAVGGKGYYQEKGKPARLLMPGDVVEIASNVVHWHGAAPDSWFSHLAIECNPQTNKNTWLDPVTDAEYAEATTSSMDGNMAATDPELEAIYRNFAWDETQQYGNLDMQSRLCVTMASTVALGAKASYRRIVETALANGITPIIIKEVTYQAVPYVGIARVEDMLCVANEVLASKGISLPLANQNVVTSENRMEVGRKLQEDIFGKEHIDAMYANAPANQLHIQQYLSANCFGDYQTRPALDAKMRELLTFSILVSMGGCEPQVKGHIAGNVNVGNDKATLLTAVTQLLPYIGYPRTLNAISCLNEVIPEK